MQTITHDGKTYTLTGEAHLSNRVFPGWWGDTKDGEEYVSEWNAYAEDKDGNQYMVVWQFGAVKGQEPEDDGWPWGDEYITDVKPI